LLFAVSSPTLRDVVTLTVSDHSDGWSAGPARDVSAEDRLAELAAAAGPLRRVLAAVAERVVATRAHERLCYARLSDYARERPGLSGRQLHELARVHRALAALPRLERALVANELPWSKARLVARVARGDDEEAWIVWARALSTRELEREVRSHAGGAVSDLEHGEASSKRIAVRCTLAVRVKWHLACELAERVAGQRLCAGEVLEQIVAEAWSSILAAADLSDRCSDRAGQPATARPDDTGAAMAAAPRSPARGLAPAIAWLAEGLEEADAGELDRRLCKAVRLEQTLDAAMAPLLCRVGSAEYAWRHAWAPLPHYAREHLGMSASKARALLRLERIADFCPALRDAYRSGRLSWVKAQCLMPLLLLDVPGEWRPSWVAWAERVTVRRLERDVERALLLRAGCDPAWHRCKFDPERAQDPIPPEEQQMCAHDVDLEATEELEIRAPRDVAVLFGALRARLSFEAMLDHALATWQVRDPAARRPDPVIERDGYRCLVPGCTSRRNLHDHHIVFRSAGGSDAPDNRVALCAFHHLRGVHLGRMRISGRAPDELTFELPLARYRSGDVALSPAEVAMRSAA
jgi:hypothetical protein